MRNFLIVLKYTILENARKKTFVISNIILVMLTVLLFNIPNISDALSDDTVDNSVSGDKQKIVIVDGKDIYDNYLNNFAIPDTNYFFATDEGVKLDDLKTKLDKNEISSIIVMNDDNNVLTFQHIVNNQSNSLSADAISEIIKNIHMNLTLSKYNVLEDDLTSISSPINYEIVQLDGEDASLSLYLMAIIGSLVLYLAIYFYGYSVSMSVSSEKTSRVMETLVTSTKPSSIVIGKTVAMGLLGLGQLMLLIITALVSYKVFVAGEFIVFGEKIDFSSITMPMISLLIVYFLLGYFLYAMLNAVTGSTVSKAEDIHSASMPVTFISLMSFYLGYFSLMTPTSPMTTFASIFPFSAAFTMPSRMLVTTVPASQVILSVVLLIATIVILAYISIKIYSAAILYYGQKLKLKDLFKMSKNN